LGLFTLWVSKAGTAAGVKSVSLAATQRLTERPAMDGRAGRQHHGWVKPLNTMALLKLTNYLNVVRWGFLLFEIQQ
jgi:hypothetical protein